MNISYLLDNLNKHQREAVAAARENLLVLAGGQWQNAGAGASYRLAA